MCLRLYLQRFVIRTRSVLDPSSIACPAHTLVSEALDDANKVIEMKPDWPKGYSRKGKGGDAPFAVSTWPALLST